MLVVPFQNFCIKLDTFLAMSSNALCFEKKGTKEINTDMIQCELLVTIKTDLFNYGFHTCIKIMHWKSQLGLVIVNVRMQHNISLPMEFAIEQFCFPGSHVFDS